MQFNLPEPRVSQLYMGAWLALANWFFFFHIYLRSYHTCPPPRNSQPQFLHQLAGNFDRLGDDLKTGELRYGEPPSGPSQGQRRVTSFRASGCQSPLGGSRPGVAAPGFPPRTSDSLTPGLAGPRLHVRLPQQPRFLRFPPPSRGSSNPSVGRAVLGQRGWMQTPFPDVTQLERRR